MTEISVIYEGITLLVAALGIVAGTITDIRTREVPDWLNFSLIASGFGIALIFSIVLYDYAYILRSVLGFLAFCTLALIMYYTGQWGGGDAKMIMGLGALFGLELTVYPLPFIAVFFINMLLMGALYGIFWTGLLIYRGRKKIVKELSKQFSKKTIKLIHICSWIIFGILIIASIFAGDSPARIIHLMLGVLAPVMFYLWLIIKAVEKISMYKRVAPGKLTEGDWIAKEIRVGKKIIAGPKDLGVSMEQIKKLQKLYKQKKIRSVLIKEGIPFVPSFLLAFIVSLLFGNIISLFLF